MKKYIPQFIKFPLWFLFKSPQRKLGWKTVYLDLMGIVAFIFNSIFFFKKFRPVSICVGISNRSDLFIDKFLSSLNKATYGDLIELSVFDCGSTDRADLKKEIEKCWKGKFIFSSESMPFSRAQTFNRAVEQSSSSILFICDADFSIPSNIVSLCNRYTRGRMAWFPIVFYLYKNKPEVFNLSNGEWMQWGGKGIVATKRKDFKKVGMLNENFSTWGQEDDELWERYYKNNFWVCRSRCRGLLHHWHLSLNAKYKELELMADKGLL